MKSFEKVFQQLFGRYRVIKKGEEIEVDCPRCQDFGLTPDTGMNLGINFRKWGFNCWRCGYHGKVNSLLARQANVKGVSRRQLPKRGDVKVRSSYNLDRGEVKVELPKGARLLGDSSYHSGRLRAYWRFRTGRVGAPHLYEAAETYPWRLVITIWEAGVLKYWQARSVQKGAFLKDINPSGVPRDQFVYGLRTLPRIRICEAVFDAECTPGGVALLGSSISRTQVQKIMSRRPRGIDICLDGDAWVKAWKVAKAFKDCGYGGDLRLLRMAEDEDPGALGLQKMSRLLSQTLTPYSEAGYLRSRL